MDACLKRITVFILFAGLHSGSLNAMGFPYRESSKFTALVCSTNCKVLHIILQNLVDAKNQPKRDELKNKARNILGTPLVVCWNRCFSNQTTLGLAIKAQEPEFIEKILKDVALHLYETFLCRELNEAIKLHLYDLVGFVIERIPSKNYADLFYNAVIGKYIPLLEYFVKNYPGQNCSLLEAYPNLIGEKIEECRKYVCDKDEYKIPSLLIAAKGILNEQEIKMLKKTPELYFAVTGYLCTRFPEKIDLLAQLVAQVNRVA